MDKRSDTATRELTGSRLKLHDDLIFTPQRFQDKTFYHIELPSRSKFYRIGLAEYTFISLLDGNTTIAEALSLTARTLAPEGFSEPEAVAICNWLLETGLARAEDSSQSAPLHAAADAKRAKQLVGRLNPFWMRLPLFNPDRLIERLFPWLGWIHSRPAIALWFVLCSVAVVAVYSDWGRFLTSSAEVFARSNWILLGLSWMALKVLHEFSHALACKKYGGEVREMGLVLILFAPLAYVDVTSCWRFRSKWQRIHTSAAGMYAELLAAAVAALLWTTTDSAVLGHLFHNIILMASLTTLVFNANPLMRFDGYYILADLLEIPNLYSSGLGYVRSVAKRTFLGHDEHANATSGARGAFIKCYGISAFVWRILVCVSLTIVASTLFHGAGLVIATSGVFLWIGQPTLRLLRDWIDHHRHRPSANLRLLLGATMLTGLAAILAGLPWPTARTAPGIVEYTDMQVVRAGSPGFVKQIHVQDGQQVKQGQLLVELENEELEVEYHDLKLALQQSQARQRILLEEQEVAARQVEIANHKSLEQQLVERKRRLDALTVRAPRSGRVMARDLSSRSMTYLEEGTEILAIGNESRKQLRVSVAQEDSKYLAAQLDRPVACRIRSRGAFDGRLARIEPRASRVPPHLALCAPLSGPLSVKTKQGTDELEQQYELVQPRFTAIVALRPSSCGSLRAGDFGVVSIRSGSEAMATVVYRQLTDWIHEKLAQVKRQTG